MCHYSFCDSFFFWIKKCLFQASKEHLVIESHYNYICFRFSFLGTPGDKVRNLEILTHPRIFLLNRKPGESKNWHHQI